MSFPAYATYRPTGVDWLGSVPSHWRVDRFKASLDSCRNGIWGDEPVGDESDIPCVRVADFDRTTLRVVLSDPTIRSVSERERAGRLLAKGDLLLEKSGGGERQPVGCVVLYDDPASAVCSNFVARVVLAPGQDSSYWRYVHAAAYAVRLTEGSINQTSGIQNLDHARYFNEPAPHPPAGEQRQIAAFLDRETAKIDALVEEQKRLIELLKEKRQAVISQAVTKGLDPTVPMKDSGVEWLGSVPAHWRVRRLKDHGVLVGGSAFPHEYQGNENETIPFYKVASLDAEADGRTMSSARNTISSSVAIDLRAAIVPTGSILWAKIGAALLLNRRRITSAPCCIDNNMTAYMPGEEISTEWAFHWTNLLDFGRFANPGAIPSLSEGYQATLPLLIPPQSEQRAIADHIDGMDSIVETLSDSATSSIALLLERRSALISAAVTGKIDVRNLIPQPEPTPA